MTIIVLFICIQISSCNFQYKSVAKISTPFAQGSSEPKQVFDKTKLLHTSRKEQQRSAK
jgi:hypothetical protein